MARAARSPISIVTTRSPRPSRRRTMLDLLVIGAGLTGLTAAIHAAQAGLSVRVITKGMSALHWSPGSIDLLGYLPDNTQVDSPIASLEQLNASHPLRHVDAATL